MSNAYTEKMKLSAPWVTYAREIKAMFGQDPQIAVEYDEDNLEVRLYVDNADKAEAIKEILPPVKLFGAVGVKITVISDTLKGKEKTVFDRAFEGNPIYSHSSKFQGLYNNPITYVVFKKEIAQYFSDNLGDENGVTSALYQDIAKDIFQTEGTYFCTEVDKKDDVIKEPLGEWP